MGPVRHELAVNVLLQVHHEPVGSMSICSRETPLQTLVQVFTLEGGQQEHPIPGAA